MRAKVHPLSLIIVLLLALAQLHSQSSIVPRRRAIMIGIDSYRSATPNEMAKAMPQLEALGMLKPVPPPLRDWQALAGSVNDARRLSLLLPKFGFTDIDQTLTNEKATHQAIVDKIRQVFIDEARDGDVLLLYYAGHGSLMRNSLSATKGDKVDETLVPWDANTGYFDLRDKELARLFNEAMAAHKITITAIFDSCHSGTMARGPHYFNPRTEPEDARDALDPYGAQKGQEPPETHGALILTATRFDQTAGEAYDDRETPPHTIDGAYTLALLRTLEVVTATTPAKEVQIQIEANLKAIIANAEASDPGFAYKQDPSMVGTPSRLTAGLFGDVPK
jgi:hypothetical protein